METQQLVELGKQMNMEGEELHGFVRVEQALAREERALIREEAKKEAVRIAAMEEAEGIRQHEKEVLRVQLESDRIRVPEASMSREMNDSVNRPGPVGAALSYVCFVTLMMIWTHIFRD